MLRWVTTALLAGSVACAQVTFPLDTPAVEYSFSQPCDVVRPAALAYFQKEGFPLAANSTCADCFTGTAKRLRDETGHRFFSNRNVIRQYTKADFSYEKVGPLTQIIHTNLRTDAYLNLRSEGSSCRAALYFGYSWYGVELVFGFPVDGDGSGAKSNGKLEAAYLHTLHQQIDHAAVASSTGPIH